VKKKTKNKPDVVKKEGTVLSADDMDHVNVPGNTAVTVRRRRSRLLRKLGSLKFGIGLMGILTLILAWATFVENTYDATFARYYIYDSWWFESLLTVLGVNLLCSALARWPWKKIHLPFLVAHFGIIILLIGCWGTAHFGREAELSVYEGEMGRFAADFAKTELAFTTLDFHKPKESSEKETLSSQTVPFYPAHDSHLKPKSELLEQQLEAMKQYPRTTVPLTLGPLNWQDCAAWNWLSGGFSHKYSLFLPVMFTKRSSGIVYSQNDVRLEIVDYYADTTLKPVEPLKVLTLWKSSDWETFELPLGGKADSMEERIYRQFDPYTKSGTTPNGERIAFKLAKSMTQTRAFCGIRPAGLPGKWGEVVVRQGDGNYGFSMEELLRRQEEFAPKFEENREKIRGTQIKISEEQNRLIASLKSRPVEEDEKKESQEKNSVQTEIQAEIDRLESELKTFQTERETLFQKIRRPIGETGLMLELVRMIPGSLAAVFRVSAQDGTSQSLYLFADAPENNTFCDRFGLTGVYFVDPVRLAEEDSGAIPPASLERIRKPRLELLQGTDKKLYYRYWVNGLFHKTGEIENRDQEILIANDSEAPVKLKIDTFMPQDLPGIRIEPRSVFQKEYAPKERKQRPAPRIRVRATVEGVEEEFWLARDETLIYSPDNEEARPVTGKTKTVTFSFPYTQVDLGFCLYLRKFEQAFDPGTGTAAHYASVVDLHRIDDLSASAVERGIRIQMNQPGMFQDQLTGRKYRVYQSSCSLPYFPGTPQYDSKLGGLLLPMEETPRDKLYASLFSINYDPGRGMKYMGCLMLVLGSIWLLWGKNTVTQTGREC
jgi:hypothetical protein